MLTELGTALSAVKAAIDLAKGLREADKAYVEAQYKLKFNDMVSILVDTQGHLHDLKSKFIELDNEKTELLRRLRQRNEVEFDSSSGLFYRKEDTAKAIPLCPKCIQSGDEKAVNMVKRHEDQWRCPVCGYTDRPHYVDLSGGGASPRY